MNQSEEFENLERTRARLRRTYSAREVEISRSESNRTEHLQIKSSKKYDCRVLVLLFSARRQNLPQGPLSFQLGPHGSIILFRSLVRAATFSSPQSLLSPLRSFSPLRSPSESAAFYGPWRPLFTRVYVCNFGVFSADAVKINNGSDEESYVSRINVTAISFRRHSHIESLESMQNLLFTSN